MPIIDSLSPGETVFGLILPGVRVVIRHPRNMYHPSCLDPEEHGKHLMPVCPRISVAGTLSYVKDFA